jgi:lipopolysaccharide exporter
VYTGFIYADGAAVSDLCWRTSAWARSQRLLGQGFSMSNGKPARGRMSGSALSEGEKARPLASRVRRGALWSVASALLLRLTNILITAVVAHILDPRDFGLFAVAMTAYAIVSAIGELGVSSCLIRADLDIDSLAPTMATVSMATSAILAAAMGIFAGPIAAALGSGAAAGPVRVMALAVILVGVFAVPSAHLVRDFKQDKLFLSNAISFVASTALLLVLAKTGSGAMAFAWSRVVGQFVAGGVMVLSVPKHYRPGLARSALSLLFRFGLPLAGANFVNYILLNVDYALVGHLMGAVELGTYVLAFNVATWPASLLSAMINNVSMPAFSRVKHDAELLKDAIAGALRALSLVVMPMSVLMGVLARPIVLTLYGAKWAGSADVLAILTAYGAVSIICSLFASILASMGQTRSLLVVQMVWLGALVPAMAIDVHGNGIIGAALAHVDVIVPIVLPFYLIVLMRVTGVSLARLAKATVPSILAAAAAGIAAKAAASQFTYPLVQLVAGVAAGGLAYIVAAAPQASVLLSQEQITKLRVGRVLRMYRTAARLAGFPASRPKHYGKRSSRRADRVAGIAKSPSAPVPMPVPAEAGQSAASAAVALELLKLLARPEPAVPRVTGEVTAEFTMPLERIGMRM